jgi:hypothetical protein
MHSQQTVDDGSCTAYACSSDWPHLGLAFNVSAFFQELIACSRLEVDQPGVQRCEPLHQWQQNVVEIPEG